MIATMAGYGEVLAIVGLCVTVAWACKLIDQFVQAWRSRNIYKLPPFDEETRKLKPPRGLM